MGAAEMKVIANLIAEVLSAPNDETVRAQVSSRVKELTAQFPLYPNRLGKVDGASGD
jgi:glycine hydroxymethyltransferase